MNLEALFDFRSRWNPRGLAARHRRFAEPDTHRSRIAGPFGRRRAVIRRRWPAIPRATRRTRRSRGSPHRVPRFTFQKELRPQLGRRHQTLSGNPQPAE